MGEAVLCWFGCSGDERGFDFCVELYYTESHHAR
jgi:hypothetical protein